MPLIRLTLPILVALFALLGPTLAAGLCGGMDLSRPSLKVEAGEHGHLPSPCELQGGKRVAPADARVSQPRQSELPRATAAQWAAGLADHPRRFGQVPATDVPPPRLA